MAAVVPGAVFAVQRLRSLLDKSGIAASIETSVPFPPFLPVAVLSDGLGVSCCGLLSCVLVWSALLSMSCPGLFCTVPLSALLCCPLPRFAVLWYALSCSSLLCTAVPCCPVILRSSLLGFCYAMLRIICCLVRFSAPLRSNLSVLLCYHSCWCAWGVSRSASLFGPTPSPTRRRWGR